MGRDWFESCGPDSAGAERVEEDKVSKFKVGDRVRILHSDYVNCGLDVGDIHEITITDNGIIFLKSHYGSDLCFYHSEVELVTQSTIQLNQTYTSKNGQKWECIAIRGDVAWLVGVYDDRPDGAAYMYKLDGSAINLASKREEYDIKWEPVVEWVDTRGSWAKKGQPHPNHHPYNIRFPLIDGKPDFMQATVTPTSDS